MIARAMAGRSTRQTQGTADSGSWSPNRGAEQIATGTGSVVVVSPDAALRQRLEKSLRAMRWSVRLAHGGAQAMALLETQPAEAMLLDDWLPDLEVGEFEGHVRLLHPETDLLRVHGDQASASAEGCGCSPRRGELLHAVREAVLEMSSSTSIELTSSGFSREPDAYRRAEDGRLTDGSLHRVASLTRRAAALAAREPLPSQPGLPLLVGSSEAMREIGRLVHMVATRSTTVLIEGETGTGKEVVARALHQVSDRAARPFTVLNCAAIPEALLEAELFGYTRGAFTGATQARVGRIEAASGGTLLLDEIGEMPLAMQAKMLRFLESSEIQRVGDNETIRVDVRLIAATHRPLEQMSTAGTFRLDLYHRLAVFPIELPPLRDRKDDIPELTEHFLEVMGRDRPRKSLTHEAMKKLTSHNWPGNVRELMHVLERGAILAGAQPEITEEEIRYRRAVRVTATATA